MRHPQIYLNYFFKIFIVTVTFYFTGFSAFAQTNLTFKVIDNKTSLPITSVTVTASQNRIVSVGKTDENGKYEFVTDAQGKIKIVCSHPDYETFQRSFDIEDDTMILEVRMRSSNVQELKEITVKAPGAVDTVFSSTRLHVEDFEVLKNGNLVLLTYSKRLNKGSEILLFDGEKILNTFPVPGRATHLENDFRGNVHVICTDKVFTVIPVGNSLKIAQLGKDYYYRYVAPILDTNGFQLYYSDFDRNYPEFSFWKYDQQDSTYDKFRTIRDDLMMELYRAEYKWVDSRTKLWARKMEQESGIDAEIWVGANYFTQSIYYKALYAPFFKASEELVVFDYYTEKMYRHNLAGELKSEVDITHHLNKKQTGWKSELLQDDVTGFVYGGYEKGGVSYLGKIDLTTGEVTQKYQLNFKYLEKMVIHDNSVYYVYRPFESPQKKFLYKERLPKDFTD